MLVSIGRKVQFQWIFNILDSEVFFFYNINVYFICFRKAKECLLGEKLEIGVKSIKALLP